MLQGCAADRAERGGLHLLREGEHPGGHDPQGGRGAADAGGGDPLPQDAGQRREEDHRTQEADAAQQESPGARAGHVTDTGTHALVLSEKDLYEPQGIGMIPFLPLSSPQKENMVIKRAMTLKAMRF